MAADGDASVGSAEALVAVLGGGGISIATNSALAPSSGEVVDTGDFGALLRAGRVTVTPAS